MRHAVLADRFHGSVLRLRNLLFLLTSLKSSSDEQVHTLKIQDVLVFNRLTE